LITVNDISKNHGDIVALNRVSFYVDQGQTTGILGPAGSGKTTLCDILSGYILCDKGTVQIDGLDMEKDGGRARAQVGYLPDASLLYPDITLTEYLTFLCGLNRVRKNLYKERISYALIQTNLERYKDRRIGTMDALAHRKAGIAGSIVFGPKIVVLDQPFSGLHTEDAAEIRYLLQELSKTYTLILCSDMLTNIIGLCKKAIILNQGKVAADSSVDNFLSLSEKRNRIRLRVAAQPQEIRAAFSFIPEIQEISFENTPEKGLLDVFVDTLKDIDIRRKIWSAAVAAEIPVLEMRSIRISTEDIFLQLTAKSGGEI